jgi:hypothetical protein
MARFDEALIKAALTAARDVDAGTEARASREERARRAELQALGGRTDVLLAAQLARSGIDTRDLAELQTQGADAADRILESHRAAGGLRSAAARNTALRGIRTRREALQQLAAGPQYVALDTPFLIWPTNGIDLDDSVIEAWGSWAKFELYVRNHGGTSQTGQEELGFYFLWENPSDNTAYVDVDAFLVLNGVCSALAEGGTFPGDRYAKVDTDATLKIFEWWEQPPTQPLPQTDQVQRASTLSVDRGGWFDYTHVEIDDVFRGFDLRYELFAVPARAVVVFEVSCAFSYELETGLVWNYFTIDDHEVICPFIQVRIRS